MGWLIPVVLFVAAFLLWRWSFKADDRLVATIRWWLSVVVLVMALVAGLAVLVG